MFKTSVIAIITIEVSFLPDNNNLKMKYLEEDVNPFSFGYFSSVQPEVQNPSDALEPALFLQTTYSRGKDIWIVGFFGIDWK